MTLALARAPCRRECGRSILIGRHRCTRGSLKHPYPDQHLSNANKYWEFYYLVKEFACLTLHEHIGLFARLWNERKRRADKWLDPPRLMAGMRRKETPSYRKCIQTCLILVLSFPCPTCRIATGSEDKCSSSAPHMVSVLACASVSSRPRS